MQPDLIGFEIEREKRIEKGKRVKRKQFLAQLRNQKETGLQEVGRNGYERSVVHDMNELIHMNQDLAEKVIFELVDSLFESCPPLEIIKLGLDRVFDILVLSKSITKGAILSLFHSLYLIFNSYPSLREQIIDIFTKIILNHDPSDILLDFDHLPSIKDWPVCQSTANFLIFLSWDDKVNVQMVKNGLLDFLLESLYKKSNFCNVSLTILSNVVTGPYCLALKVLQHPVLNEVFRIFHGHDLQKREECSFVIHNLTCSLKTDDFSGLIGKIDREKVVKVLKNSSNETISNVLKFCLVFKASHADVFGIQEIAEDLLASKNEEVYLAARSFLENFN
jgi:hypothetical protein